MGCNHDLPVSDPHMPHFQISIYVPKVSGRICIKSQNADSGKKLIYSIFGSDGIAALFYSVFQLSQSNCGDTQIFSHMLFKS